MNLINIKDKALSFIWQPDIKSLSPWKRSAIKLLRVYYAAARDLAGGLPSLRAMGLVYTTLLSLVPLLAVSFSVLKGFGAHNQLEPALLGLLEPLGEKSTQIVEQVIGFVDNMKVGALGSFGLLMLIFTVLSLVKKIESAFNFTWKLTTTRSLAQRFSNYLSVIMVGPVLIFTAIGITASVNNSSVVNGILAIEPFGSLILLAGELLPFILTIAVYTFIYVLVPNTKVKIKSAFTGAIAATVLSKIIGWVFTAFIVNSTNYTAIYSSFAILIIFMLWIYATWLILLSGASVAFYHQYPERTSNRQQLLRLSCRMREKLALTIMQMTGSHFHQNKEPWSSLALSKELDISEEAILLVISALTQEKLLIQIADKTNTYIPARSLEEISICAVMNAIRKAEETPLLNPDEIRSSHEVEELINKLEMNSEATFKTTSIKDIISLQSR